MKITDQYGVAGCVLLIEERFTNGTHLRTPTFDNWILAPRAWIESQPPSTNSRVQHQTVSQMRSTSLKVQSRFGRISATVSRGLGPGKWASPWHARRHGCFCHGGAPTREAPVRSGFLVTCSILQRFLTNVGPGDDPSAQRLHMEHGKRRIPPSTRPNCRGLTVEAWGIHNPECPFCNPSSAAMFCGLVVLAVVDLYTLFWFVVKMGFK